jgi:hypothetical protein
MSNTSIFDLLNSEAPAGSKYEDLVSFEIPPFVWGPTVSLLKKSALDDTLGFQVVKPIAVMSLTKRTAA